jgi:hypothetical protein
MYNLLNINLIFGAGERIRTSDLLITNQLLCQLSYTGFVGIDSDWNG